MRYPVITVLFILVAITQVWATEMAGKHPLTFTTPPKCSQCHQDQRSLLDHGPDYLNRHPALAKTKGGLCVACHERRFCADCHTNKDELKPSEKHTLSPYRGMPHRGDYLSRHQIEARVNPARCYTCHRKGNNRKCLTCHR